MRRKKEVDEVELKLIAKEKELYSRESLLRNS
jgi:hypothetical protein